MLAVRACLFRSPFTCQSLVSRVQAPKHGLVTRFFGNEALRTKVGARATRRPIAEKIPIHTPVAVGKMIVAGSSLVGLGSLAYYGLHLSSESGLLEQSLLWPQYVRDRVRDTYMYVAASLGVTVASTVAIYRSPSVFRLFNAQSVMGFILPLACVWALGSAMHSIPYEPGFGAKQALWLLHSSMVGGIIAPLMMLGGPALLHGAVMVAGVFTGLSTIAMCAPSDKFMNMAAPLSIAAGAVLASCIGTIFLPPTSLAGASLHSVAMYGGVVLFSLLLLYQTQALMHKAKSTSYSYQFDPINASSGIYMCIINLFMRFVMMNGMGKKK